MSIDRLSFTIPGPPCAKGRPRFTKTGRAYTPGKTRTYEELVRWHARVAMKGREPFLGPCSVSVVAYLPIPQSWPITKRGRAMRGEMLPTVKPDADNLLKAILDPCNLIVWKDDAQAVDIRVVKRYSADPRVAVAIVNLGACDRGIPIIPTEATE